MNFKYTLPFRKMRHAYAALERDPPTALVSLFSKSKLLQVFFLELPEGMGLHARKYG
jgi:hypothetical protein